MKTKTTKHAFLILFTAVAFTGCEDDEARKKPSSPPDPVEILEERIQVERDLRVEAEARVDKEAGSRGRWELAAIALGILAMAGFVGGTAIGSKGRRHAELA